MAQPKKTASEIITKFELQVSDVTELSSSEELDLLNTIYQKICNKKPWEFLKVPAAGSILSDATGSYITTPADFAYFIENNSYTDNSMGAQNNAAPKVIFVITSSGAYQPYQIINFSDRRQYLNRVGFAYFDAANNVIRFTGTPQGSTYEFDYIKVPPNLAVGDYPVFPGQFHDILFYGMATDNDILQLSPKATSYAAENNVKFTEIFDDMVWWNAQLMLN